MKANETYYTELITRYLTGEIEPAEIRLLEQWVSEDPGNKQQFTEFVRTWRLLNRPEFALPVDTRKDWDVVRSKILDRGQMVELSVSSHTAGERTLVDSAKEQPNQASKHTEIRMKHWSSGIFFKALRVAAIFLLFVAPVYMLYRYLLSEHEITAAAYGEPREVILPDGSAITLNAGSHIIYSSAFNGPLRQVTLDGQAWFAVAKDKSRPFIITSGAVRIRVAGTTFFVDTRTPDDTKEVILETGCVRVYYHDHPGDAATLLQGERAETVRGNNSIVKSKNDDPNFLAWKTRHIVFDNTPLATVVQVLERVYRQKIVIADDRIAACPITVTFDDKPLEPVLKVISATLELEVIRSGETISIAGKKCNPGR